MLLSEPGFLQDESQQWAKGQSNSEYSSNDCGFILKYFTVKKVLYFKWLLRYEDQKYNKP